MRLSDKQRLFMMYLPRLLDYIYQKGYAVTLGDGYRDPRVFGLMGSNKDNAYGRTRSNHKIRLAIDLNLFKRVDGKWEYCTDSEDHREFGEYWESLDPICSWGGHWGDGNHYSVEHNGRR